MAAGLIARVVAADRIRMMLLTMTALLPAVLTRMPKVSWIGLRKPVDCDIRRLNSDLAGHGRFAGGGSSHGDGIAFLRTVESKGPVGIVTFSVYTPWGNIDGVATAIVDRGLNRWVGKCWDGASGGERFAGYEDVLQQPPQVFPVPSSSCRSSFDASAAASVGPTGSLCVNELASRIARVSILGR